MLLLFSVECNSKTCLSSLSFNRLRIIHPKQRCVFATLVTKLKFLFIRKAIGVSIRNSIWYSAIMGRTQAKKLKLSYWTSTPTNRIGLSLVETVLITLPNHRHKSSLLMSFSLAVSLLIVFFTSISSVLIMNKIWFGGLILCFENITSIETK